MKNNCKALKLRDLTGRSCAVISTLLWLLGSIACTGDGVGSGTTDTGRANSGGDTAISTSLHFLSAYGNGSTIDLLELDGQTGAVVELGEWPGIVGYNGSPIVIGSLFVTLGVVSPSDVDAPRLSSVNPYDLSTAQQPLLSDNRVGDFIDIEGALYGVISTGTAIELGHIDMVNGQVTSVGTVADMAVYYPRAVYLGGTIYAQGESASDPGATKLYSINPAAPASAVSAALTVPFAALYGVDGELIGMRGDGTVIELYTLTPSTGAEVAMGVVPDMYQIYAPNYGALNDHLYLLGSQSAGAATRLYNIPIHDIASTHSIPLDRDPADLHIYP
jgi:hypothetical protein